VSLRVPHAALYVIARMEPTRTRDESHLSRGY
jgi:hypothetical protein